MSPLAGIPGGNQLIGRLLWAVVREHQNSSIILRSFDDNRI
jgi:hypothetical protein